MSRKNNFSLSTVNDGLKVIKKKKQFIWLSINKPHVILQKKNLLFHKVRTVHKKSNRFFNVILNAKMHINEYISICYSDLKHIYLFSIFHVFGMQFIKLKSPIIASKK